MGRYVEDDIFLFIASSPDLPSQLFSQPCAGHFSTAVKKATRGGLGTKAFFHTCKKSCEERPGYEATLFPGFRFAFFLVLHKRMKTEAGNAQPPVVS